MNKLPHRLAVILFILGLGLTARLAQYIFNRSLWLDEAFLTFNILERDFAGFLQPLSDNQIAPPGFLCVEKFFVLLFGHSEYALRAFPLIAGIASVLLLYRVARSSLGLASAVIAVALLAWSQPLIYYASEVKPYASDVLLALVAYALCLPMLRDNAPAPWRRAIVAGLFGAACVWFSYPAAFVLASIGVALLARPLFRRNGRRILMPAVVLAMWGVSLAALYWTVLRQGFANESLRAFWGDFFATFPPRTLSDIYWFAQLFFDFLVQSAGMPFYGLATFAWLAGAVVLWKRGQWPMVLTLVLPLGFAMAAAAMRRYPFFGRTLLFAVPPTLLLMAHGAQAAFRSLVKDSRAVAVIFIGALLFHPFYRTLIVLPQPLTTEEIKPVLQHVRDQWQPGDRLYVYHAAARPFAYYAPRYGFGDERPYRVGRSSDGNFAILTEDMEAMQGTRVWFLFVHIYSYSGISEDAFMLDQLNQRWPRLDVFKAPGAVVYLYDLR
jgi:4-amino-4-deoxy-L-arabinose transferase-like glycosyltransferase